MPQQRGMKRAEKVTVRKRKLKVRARAANIRRVERQAEVAAKEGEAEKK
jgi:hypothetical protein